MQPLRDVDRPEVRPWAVDWLEALVELQGQSLTPDERGRFAHARLHCSPTTRRRAGR